MALFHVHGLQNGVHGTLVTGCTTVLPDGPADGARLLATIAAERCSMMFGVPTHYRRLLDAAESEPERCREVAGHMRVFISGSAPLHPETFRRFQERFGHAVLERYGMTETLMIASNPLRGERRPGTVGYLLPGLAARVVDPDSGADRAPGDFGEIWVRGPSVFEGYHRRPGFPHPADAEAFEAGWFRTSDLGAWEPDGRLRLVGRRNDLIISGGMNVAPSEVEQVLLTHADVIEAGVTGVPDDDLGETVAAAVVLRAGTALDLDGLARHVAERLAGFKKPRRLLVVDVLPRNAVGKLNRAALRARLAAAPPTSA